MLPSISDRPPPPFWQRRENPGDRYAALPSLGREAEDEKEEKRGVVTKAEVIEEGIKRERGGLFRFGGWVWVGYPGIPFRMKGGEGGDWCIVRTAQRAHQLQPPSITHCGAVAGYVGVKG